MVDLLYRFAKRPLGASPLLRKIAASISPRAARSCAPFACTTAGWLLINALFHSAAADLDIAKAPARYSAIGAVQSTARHSSRQETPTKTKIL